MNTLQRTDHKAILSSLWIFAVLTYIFADLAPMIFQPGTLLATEKAADGYVLGFAVFMQSAIAMVVLARILPYRANRLANAIAGAGHAAVIAWTLLVSSPPASYVFSATLVIACGVLIVWYAWTWPSPEAQTGTAGNQSGLQPN
jgi:hypothetical protein